MDIPIFAAECIGTFLFVLVILCLTMRDSSSAIPASVVPLLIGLGLAVSIYVATGLGGNGHLNPAVSVIMGWNNSIQAADVLPHLLAQCVGAGCAYVAFQSIKSLKA